MQNQLRMNLFQRLQEFKDHNHPVSGIKHPPRKNARNAPVTTIYFGARTPFPFFLAMIVVLVEHRIVKLL